MQVRLDKDVLLCWGFILAGKFYFKRLLSTIKEKRSQGCEAHEGVNA